MLLAHVFVAKQTKTVTKDCYQLRFWAIPDKGAFPLDYARLSPCVIPKGGQSSQKAGSTALRRYFYFPKSLQKHVFDGFGKIKTLTNVRAFWLAERGGFEPPVRTYYGQRFSRPPHSTTLPSLLIRHKSINSFMLIKIYMAYFIMPDLRNESQECFCFVLSLYTDRQFVRQESIQYHFHNKVSTVFVFHANSIFG